MDQKKLSMPTDNLRIIEQLPEKRWEELRDLRLAAVKDVPHSFLDTPVEVMDYKKSHWVEKLPTTILAEVEGKLVGMIAPWLEKREKVKHVGHIGAFYVLPEYRGKGVGKILLEKAIERHQKNPDISKILIEVNPLQKVAHNLYLSFGFKKVGEYKKQVNIDGTFHDEYLMEMFI